MLDGVTHPVDGQIIFSLNVKVFAWQVLVNNHTWEAQEGEKMSDYNHQRSLLLVFEEQTTEFASF